MTVLSRISVHFGATQRTHGEKLHTTTQKETKGGEGNVDLKDKKADPHFTTASLLTPKNNNNK